MTAEDWRPIAGFPKYEVSSLGRVMSYARGKGRLLKQEDHTSGRFRVDLGGRNNRYVHQLVALAFLGPTPEGQEIRHLNGDAHDNRLSNIAFGTHSDNMQDRVRHGTDPNARKTHCPQGHAYSPDNTYVRPGRRGRYCRTCLRERDVRRALRAANVRAAA